MSSELSFRILIYTTLNHNTKQQKMFVQKFRVWEIQVMMRLLAQKSAINAFHMCIYSHNVSFSNIVSKWEHPKKKKLF